MDFDLGVVADKGRRLTRAWNSVCMSRASCALDILSCRSLSEILKVRSGRIRGVGGRDSSSASEGYSRRVEVRGNKGMFQAVSKSWKP